MSEKTHEISKKSEDALVDKFFGDTSRAQFEYNDDDKPV